MDEPVATVAADSAGAGVRLRHLADRARRGVRRAHLDPRPERERRARSWDRWSEFSRTFVWVVAARGLAVLVLSGTQIRRSLVPLVELREGTRRIAQRDFAQPGDGHQPRRVRGAGDRRSTRWPCSSGRQFQALVDRRGARPGGALGHGCRVDRRHPAGAHPRRLSLPPRGRDAGGAGRRQVAERRASTTTATTARHSAPGGPALRGRPGSARRARPDAAGRADGGACPAYLDPLLRLGAALGAWCCRCASSDSSSGILAARRPQRRRGAGADERLQLRRLADQVAVALANARMLEQVKSLAYYDSLTGLPNRLSYKERLAQALEQARRRPASWWRRSSSTSTTSAGSTTPWATRRVTSCSSRWPLRLRASCRDREDEVGPAAGRAGAGRGPARRRRVHRHHSRADAARGRGQARPPHPEQPGASDSGWPARRSSSTPASASPSIRTTARIWRRC